jgi:hypothetical protein
MLQSFGLIVNDNETIILIKEKHGYTVRLTNKLNVCYSLKVL